MPTPNDRFWPTLYLIILLLLLNMVDLIPVAAFFIGGIVSLFALYLLISFRYSWPLLAIEISLLLTGLRMMS